MWLYVSVRLLYSQRHNHILMLWFLFKYHNEITSTSKTMFFLLSHLGIWIQYTSTTPHSYLYLYTCSLSMCLYFFYDNIWLPFSYISANNGKVVACTLHNTTIAPQLDLSHIVMEHNFSDPRKANEKKKENMSAMWTPIHSVLRNDIWRDRSPLHSRYTPSQHPILWDRCALWNKQYSSYTAHSATLLSSYKHWIAFTNTQRMGNINFCVYKQYVLCYVTTRL